jgi:diguanylate cyclase (GGDEF)-like protein
VKKVLLIDDNQTILKILKLKIYKSINNINIITARSFLEAEQVIKEHKDIFVAVVDLNLNDCNDGDAALLTSSNNIPTIVLTELQNTNLKSILLQKDVLDYITKSSKNSIEYTTGFIKKIIRNHNTTALVVDDSRLFRKKLIADLKKLHINVLATDNGEDALKIIESSKKKISLVITDYYMPKINGIDLSLKLREKYNKDDLAIIAISASQSEFILTDFIKAGANDFLAKPYTFTELNVRVNSNLDTLELFQITKDLANKDYLTGSYNRRYFFEVAKGVVAKNIRQNKEIALATLDIDNFKTINDTFGHDIGDIAIKEISSVLEKSVRKSDLYARFGGEEYCILLENISLEDTEALFERVRKDFERNVIRINNTLVNYTVSIGVVYGKCDSLQKMIKRSDEALYTAKNTGRNKVVIYS